MWRLLRGNERTIERTNEPTNKPTNNRTKSIVWFNSCSSFRFNFQYFTIIHTKTLEMIHIYPCAFFVCSLHCLKFAVDFIIFLFHLGFLSLSFGFFQFYSLLQFLSCKNLRNEIFSYIAPCHFYELGDFFSFDPFPPVYFLPKCIFTSIKCLFTNIAFFFSLASIWQLVT